jgi:hypothetical protein
MSYQSSAYIEAAEKERTNLNATERLYAFPQHASDSRELIE